MISLRCSGNDRVNACTASATPPAVRIEIPNAAAPLGSAVHECLTKQISGVAADFADVAFRHDDVDADELGSLFAQAWAAWKRIERYFPDPITEHEFEPIAAGREDTPDFEVEVLMTGHADLISISADGATISILDWKSGWGDGEHEYQLKGYALLAIREIPTADKVRGSVMKIRHGDVETYEWSREELEAWWLDFVQRTIAGAEVYRPSPAACGFCPRFAECPARQLMVRSVAGFFAENDPAEVLPLMTAEGLAGVVSKARTLIAAAEVAVDVVRAIVIGAGGEVSLPDGRSLKMTSTVRTEIDFAAGEDVLRANCGDQLGKALSVRKTKSKSDPTKLGIAEICKARVGRGEKGKAVEQMMYELDQAGALKTTTIQKLELTKATKAITTTTGEK